MKKKTLMLRLHISDGILTHSKRSIVTTFLAIYCLLVTSSTSTAQNPTGHYENIYSQALDYMGSGEYMLMGRSDPPTISTYDNSAPFGNNKRIHLQVLDPDFLTSLSSKTYCTQDEITMIQNSHCNKLSVSFYPRDAKQTSDGGFIICGNVRRDMETNSCGLPEYHNEFLLKVSSTGAVQWYRRYAESQGVDLEFRSVIETNTGNFIVCGTYGGTTALMVATDNSGTVINSHIMNMNLYTDPSRSTPTDYREVAAFSTLGTVYYALVGASYSYMPIEGGVLITFVDGGGNTVTNTVVTSAAYDVGLVARAVTGTYDGEIAITGEALPYNANLTSNGGLYSYNFMPFVLKLPFLGPMFGTVSFLKSYQDPNVDVVPYSITASEGGIHFSGDHRGRGAFRYSVDFSGNWLSGDTEAPQTGYYSNAIIFDAGKGYPVYSGDANVNTYPSFVTTDEYGNNLCGGAISIAPIDIPYNYHTSSETLITVSDIYDEAVDFNVQTVESIFCGIARPGLKSGNTSGISNTNVDSQLKLLPNPASEFIDVSIPQSFTHGKMEVVNMLGQVVVTKDITGTSNKSRVDISSLNKGVYILSIKDNTVMQQAQFVKY